MKKIRWIFIGIGIGVLLIAAFLWMGFAKNTTAVSGQGVVTITPQPPDRSDEYPSANRAMGAVAPNALPTPIPGESLVYFLTADSDTTATVVNLYNTDSVSHTVALRGYSYTGVLGYSLNIDVPASSFLRLASDSIAAAPPPSWATPAPIITNFTDFTYYASLSLPKGVKVEGYTLYNPG